eukprot:SAG11_NODE_304_length_10999_cov_3.121376_1_plen_1446_part_10
MQVFGAASDNSSKSVDPFVELMTFLQKSMRITSVPGAKEDLMKALGQLARHCDSPRSLTSLVVTILLAELTDGNNVTSVIANDEIREIAHARFARRKRGSDAVKHLFESVKDELYVGIALQWFRVNTSQLDQRVAQVAELLEQQVEDLKTDVLEIALPQMVAMKLKRPLEHLERFIGKEIANIMLHSDMRIRKILSCGLLQGGSRHVDFLKFFAKMIHGKVVDAERLVSDHSTYVLEAAVWEMGKVEPIESGPRERALACLQFVAKLGKEQHSSIEVLLKGHLPLLLEHLNVNLDGRRQSRQDNLMGSSQNSAHALRCLKSVIEIMRDNLVNQLPAITSTLKNVLHRDHLQSTALEVWFSLVTCVSPSYFGPHLCQIVGHLLPLREKFKEKTLRILDHLIVNNRQALKQHFHELLFVNESAELIAINVSIQQEVGPLPEVQRLNHLICSMGNESATVRMLALTALKADLQMKWVAVAELVRGAAEVVHPVIGELVSQLRRGCSDLDPDVKRLSVQCFGELGAIDPSKLPPSVARRADTKIKKLSHIPLVATLICDYLVKVVKAAKGPLEHDRAAFAIQELLKLNNCIDANASAGRRPRRASDRSNLLALLDEETQKLVEPLMTSRYALGAASKFVFQGFATSARKNHQKWVREWAYHLISRLPEGAEKSCFMACRTVIRMDMNTAHFVLPYLVWETLWNAQSDEFVFEIQHEMTALLGATRDMRQVVESQLVLFDLLDVLQSWSRQHRMSTPVSKIPRGLRTVEGLLQRIPRKELATAALQCKAYQRALLNFEEHLRDQYTTQSSSALSQPASAISILQEIYRGLDNSDALAGVATLRSGSTSLMETVIDLEAAGKWTDALTCYNVLMQQESKSAQLHNGLMTCMRELGYFEAVATHARGVISTPSPQAAINERQSSVAEGIRHAAAAAWRLGQWDTIKEVECHASTDKGQLDVCVASILRKLHTQADRVSLLDIESDIARVRRRLTPGMSAACMESYERAYPIIVDLQLLQELEFSCREQLVPRPAKCGGEDAISFSRHMEMWNYRLQITKPDQRLREPILAVRRAILSQTRCLESAKYIGETWLQLARIARTEASQKLEGGADQLQAAAGALMQPAATHSGLSYHIEKAKLLWDQEKFHDAVRVLETQVVKSKREDSDNHTPMLHAEMELLLAKYAQRTGEKHSEDIHAHFTNVRKTMPRWDKGYFALAQYLDKMYAEAKKRDSQKKTAIPNKKQRMDQGSTEPPRRKHSHAMVTDVIYNYGQALVNGHSYIFQCLPRLLTLWFEFGDVVQDELEQNRSVGTRTIPQRASGSLRAAHHGSSSKSGMSDLGNIEARVHAIIEQLQTTIPSYQWFTALPQLISRTGHKHAGTQALLKKVIATIVANHPLQASWLVVPATKTKNRFRAATALEIIRDAESRLRGTKHAGLLKEADSFVRALTILCDH